MSNEVVSGVGLGIARSKVVEASLPSQEHPELLRSRGFFSSIVMVDCLVLCSGLTINFCMCDLMSSLVTLLHLVRKMIQLPWGMKRSQPPPWLRNACPVQVAGPTSTPYPHTFFLRSFLQLPFDLSPTVRTEAPPRGPF
jgi:hypothetical protein